MDGMKLDEEYRQKNGLVPPDPKPKNISKKPTKERVTFDVLGVDDVEEKSKKTFAKTESKSKEENIDKINDINQQDLPEETGFIDKVLAENDDSKKKVPKKAKKSPKPKKEEKNKKTKPPKQKKKQKVAPKKDTKSKAQKHSKSKKVFHGSLTQQLIMVGKMVIFAAIIIFALYNYLEVKRLNNILDSEAGGQSYVDEKNKKVIESIEEFRLLPDSEYEIYTVKDKTKLVSDPVFNSAENGDKVIVYPEDSLTIVYRESDGKIISESRSSSLTEK